MAGAQEEESGERNEQTEENSADVVKSTRPEGGEELRQKYDELNERYLRLAADFENYQKRTARDLDTRVRYAIERFAVELLEVADNFDRALKEEGGSSREGLEQIRKLFRTVLMRHGISPIETVGKHFDPAEHEALVSVPSERPEGEVIDEICRGYRMHERVIRCAKVAVAKNEKSE
jgi:molecular chaperone GrpE